MELNWSTFLLEILNFLILVWILKHFLYKPVLDILARRRTDIEEKIAAAKRLNTDAESLKAEYENRLAVWDHERQQAREELAQELNEERLRQLADLQTILSQEREKAVVADARQRVKTEHEIEHRALKQGARFAARLLSQASGPELENRLVTLLLDGLANLPPDQTNALRTQWGESSEAISVASAYPLSTDQRQCLERVLAGIGDVDSAVHFEQDAELLAGLRITIGSWVLNANVKDDLGGFTEFAHVVS